MEKYNRKFFLKEEEFKGDNFYERKYSNSGIMDGLELSLENDSQLYRQHFLPIIKNIQRKIKSGRYDHRLAPKLWLYYIENGAKKYAEEFKEYYDYIPPNASWNNIFIKKDREILAQKLADYYYDSIIRIDDISSVEIKVRYV